MNFVRPNYFVKTFKNLPVKNFCLFVHMIYSSVMYFKTLINTSMYLYVSTGMLLPGAVRLKLQTGHES